MQKYKFKTLVERIKDTVDPNSVTSNFPYIGLANIEPGSFEINEIGKAKDVNSTKYKFNSGDVLYGKLRPYFHKSYMPNFDGICSTDIWVLRTKDEGVLKQDYLYHIVRTPYFDSITNISTGGTDRPRAKWDYIKEQEIDIPESNVQNAISSFLNSIDKLIANNSHRIEILEQITKAIYREWFVEFRFPGYEDVPMVDSELGEIPMGWEVSKLENVIDYHIGGSWGKGEPTGDFSIPVFIIRGTDIPEARRMDFSNCPLRYLKQSYYESRKMYEGDIVFEVSGGSTDQPVGRPLYICKSLLDAFPEKVICASFCKLIRINHNILKPQLFYLHLLDIYENRKINKYQVQSTGIKNLKFSHFLDKHMVLIPQKIVQNEFIRIIDPILTMINTLGEKNQILKDTRDLLLPKLISGELDISSMYKE